MKIHAIILAGGKGTRMGRKTPKQFIEVDGVPIIIKTLENFEKHPLIDKVTIVCIKDYIDEMNNLVNKYHIHKVNNIVIGGDTGHDSTRNGIYSLKDQLDNDDFVIIHDAVRPILPQDIISQMIEVAKKNGNACLAVPCYETVVLKNDNNSGDKEIDRNSFVRVQTPQMYKYGLIKSLYEQADRDNKHNFIYANTLAIAYGTRIFFSPGFTYNFKITTEDDLPIYHLMIELENEGKIE